MWRSTVTVICVPACTLLFVAVFSSVANASAIPTSLSSTLFIQSNPGNQIGQDHYWTQEINGDDDALALPNSFSLIPSEGFLTSFDNGTSLLRGKMQRRFHRVKRDACKERPETEVMEYYDLKLPNRCWDNCDCRAGRYCTSHSWCHDLPKQ